MAGVSVDQFGKALVAAGLFTADEVKAIWGAIPAADRPKDGAGFAQFLVAKEKLTQFQADELLAGRTTPLVMGDYVLLAKIGEGGMGQVFKARHKRMNRLVGLKVMSAAAMKDEGAVKRFQREVHAAARLEHPNIVTAYDSGEVGAVKYLVMQFVDGGDLSSLVKKNGPLEIERAVDYVIQAAKGLAFAHGEGVIHRDIKPANLLVDKKGVVKILDMGLARFEDGSEGLTATEQVMGTVDYMSPEQAANTKGVDGRADIYSLGCTLWFLLTGKKLYDGDTMIGRLMAHRDAELPSLVKTRDDAPWPLEQAFHKMIAKRAQDRYQTMDEVVAALAPFGSSGGGSPSGMDSSIGQSGGPQDAELASFLKTVGPGAKSQAKAQPSKTNVDVEATAQFDKPDAGTDPKSEILPQAFGRDPKGSAPSAKPQAKGRGGKKGPPVKLIAAGAGGLAVLVVALIVLFSRSDEPGVSATGVSETNNAPVANAPGSPQPTSTAAALPAFRSKSSPASTISFLTPVTTTTAPPPPPGDYALLFDGNGVVEFDDPLPYAVDACTVEAFVRTDAHIKRAAVYAVSEHGELGMSPADGSFWVMRHTQDPSASSKVGGHYNAITNEPAELGRRIHLAGVYDKTGYRLYVDGKLAAKTPPMLDRKFTLGKRPPNIGSLFKGVIDEVRISNKARYSGNFTPAPRHDPDADTLALYHCDEGVGKMLVDSSGHNRHGRIVSAKWVTASGSAIPATGTGHFALEFDGTSPEGIVVDSLATEPLTPLTIEVYVQPAGNFELAGVHPVAGFLRRIALFQEAKVGTPIVSVGHHQNLNFPYFQLKPSSSVDLTRNMHWAAVWSNDKVQLFLDGKLVAERVEKIPTPPDKLGVLSIGRAFVGRLDEIRVSKVARYDRDFTPQPRFEPDADTLVLYHCDEGTGSVLRDASGNNHHVPFTHAKFVPVAAPAASPPAAPVSNAQSPTPGPSPTIPAEALTFNGHRYLLVDSFGTWNQAKAKAEAMGGHLATITSKEERFWIRENAWIKRTNTQPRAGNMFLGGTSAGPGGSWTWITGEPFDPSLWIGTPSANAGRGLMWMVDAQWGDVLPDDDNSRSFYFLVEWDALGP